MELRRGRRNATIGVCYGCELGQFVQDLVPIDGIWARPPSSAAPRHVQRVDIDYDAGPAVMHWTFTQKAFNIDLIRKKRDLGREFALCEKVLFMRLLCHNVVRWWSRGARNVLHDHFSTL